MDELGKETDLSQELPSRRSWLPARRPSKVIGKHRRAVLRPRRPWRTRRRAQISVARIIDLPRLEGDPTHRADPGLVRLGAEMRPLRGRVWVEIEAPAESPPGAAVTVVILLGAGAVLGACGFAAGDLWRFPSALSVIAVSLLFISPVIAYFGLRRRG